MHIDCRCFTAGATGCVETVKPSISEMANVTELENRRVVIDCRTRGDPAPTLTFRKDNGPPFQRGVNVSAL